MGAHDEAGRPSPLRNTISGPGGLDLAAGINEYDSLAVGFDNKVMNEADIVDGSIPANVSLFLCVKENLKPVDDFDITDSQR